MELAATARFRASAATVAVAAAALFGLSVAIAPEALAACNGSIVYSSTGTTVTNTSQCNSVRASIEGYVSGGSSTTFYGAISANKSVVNLPSGASYVRNGMGLKPTSTSAWQWSYWVY